MINTILTAALFIGLLCAMLGGILLVIARFGKHSEDDRIAQVESLLPQTQCGQCDFPGCRPYAVAIIEQSAPINRCPPGGAETIQKLAALLNREETALSVEEKPLQVAVIEEAACIGCTKCIPVCPVDAIIGARGQMHTIIPDRCTGCELCLAPCPMDCISLVKRDLSTPWKNPLIQDISP